MNAEHARALEHTHTTPPTTLKPYNPTGRHLAGVEPQRPLGGKVLGQDGEHALHGAEDGAVHDDRPLPGPVLGHVLQPEADGQLEVELEGGWALGAG